MDSNIHLSTGSLFSLDPLDVDDEFLSVALDDLADLLSLALSPDNLDLVVLADGHRLDAVLLLKLLVQGRGHKLPPDVGGRLEVTLAVLPPGRAHVGVQTNHLVGMRSFLGPKTKRKSPM